MLRGASCVVLLSLAAGQVSGQSMRTFTASRRLESVPALNVAVEFGSGYLSLRPDDEGMLYAAEMRYDQERGTPYHHYDQQQHRLELKLTPVGNGGVRVTNREQMAQRATVTLAPSIPLMLDVALGAGEGELELGGLKLRSAAVHSMATRTLIRVSSPNAMACETLDLDGGAAEVITEHLGNLRCAEIRFEGGVGATTLDLTGRWTSTLRVRAKQALGNLRLILPKDAGVRIVLDRTLTSFVPVGFTREGGAWVTPNARTAPRTIQVDITTAVGGIEVVWE